MKIHGNSQFNASNQIASYLADTGTANIYVVSMRPVIAGYTEGLLVHFKAVNANTGPSTLNVNGLGAAPLVKDVSFPLIDGDILAGEIVTAIYDGTNFQIISSDNTSFLPCGLFQGGIVTWVSGLIFDISPADYKLCCEEGVRHSLQTQVTLSAADPANPRFDAIILDQTGVVVLEGTPSANPDFPQPADCQILLTYIYIPAGATEPGNGGCGIPSQVTIYDETGGIEWTPTAVGPTINFTNTSNVFHLTKAADVGAFSASQSFNFLRGAGTINLTNYTALKFYIRLKSTFHPQAKFGIFFQNTSTVQPTSAAIMQNGQYGFDRTVVGTYQIITIPISAFLSGVTSVVDKLYFLFLNQGNANGFYIDWIQLQEGICQPPNTGGQSGYSGISGYSGKSGYSGYTGFSGYSSLSGFSGYSGISGYSGYSALSGYSAYSGAGLSGFSGYSGTGGGATTADNGLTMSTATNVQLGATAAGANSPLLHDTYINTGTKRLTISGDKDRMLWVSSASGRTAYFEGADANAVLTIINAGGARLNI